MCVLSHVQPGKRPFANSRHKLTVSNAPRSSGPIKAKATRKTALQKAQLQNFPSKRQRIAEESDHSLPSRKARAPAQKKRNRLDEYNDDIDFVPDEEDYTEESDVDDSESTVAPISIASDDEDDEIEFEMPVKIKQEMMATQGALRREPPAARGARRKADTGSDDCWNQRLYDELKKRLQQARRAVATQENMANGSAHSSRSTMRTSTSTKNSI